MAVTHGDVVVAVFISAFAALGIVVWALNRRADRRREFARGQAEYLAAEWRKVAERLIRQAVDSGNVEAAVRDILHISQPTRAVLYLPGGPLHDPEVWMGQ